MQVIIASAFCRYGQGGNLAGVVLESDFSPDAMQAAASQFGYSETVFIQKGSRYSALYYTPDSPIDFCGHASLAAFKALDLPAGRYPLNTKAGTCIVEVNSLIYLSQPLPIFGECIPADEIATVLGVYPHGVAQIVSTGLRDILVPVASLDISPNFEKIEALCEKYDTIGMHLFTLGPEIHVRNFAPRYGIPEESATGSSNGALACYLYHHGLLQKSDYLFRQGDGMNLPSDIHVRLATENKTIKSVACGGEVRIQETRCFTLANRS